MKRTLTIIAALALLAQPSAGSPQQPGGDEWRDRSGMIPEVTVWGRRPMKEIGMQKTTVDSVVMTENIALSMADALTFGTSVFVKSYGRATLSTVSFRGTSPSHTQVTWNGMKINSPMLGMTDFSMIPAYFIDDASLLHGTSSVNDTGGGLGGAVKLSTAPAGGSGFGMQYIQGVGSFRTADEFLRLTYGDRRWQLSTRAVLSSSPNRYKYRNHDKKENIYDEDRNIIGQYYPVETNRSGAWRDFHILQEAYLRTRAGDRFGARVWYLGSRRELPMLTTDYGEETDFENLQRERTLRALVSWDRIRSLWKASASAGYVHTWMAYDYKRDRGNGTMASMTRSRSRINTFYGQAEGEFAPNKRWLFTASLAAYQHLVTSADKNIILQEGGRAIVGYDMGRLELSGAVSAKWQATRRLGLSAVLREELYGTTWAPVIPALFADLLVSERGNVMMKASVSRNFRYPTLNDLYFLPGGNPDLRPERGFSYDVGVSFATAPGRRVVLSGSASWFESRIDDWILWLPTTKGFFSPRNIKDVHAYGIETAADLDVALSGGWRLDLDGTLSWTPSINCGEPMSPADQSVGKQLPYVPELSAAVTGRLCYRTWSLLYKWCYYSRRYTMTSNDLSLTGRLPEYFMSDITIEKTFSLPWADLSVKGSVNNLFDEEYLSVLSRPMPGINFEIFFSITPKWGARRAR